MWFFEETLYSLFFQKRKKNLKNEKKIQSQFCYFHLLIGSKYIFCLFVKCGSQCLETSLFFVAQKAMSLGNQSLKAE